jgi:competence protein ComEC
MAAVYRYWLTENQAGTALAMVLGDKSGLLDEQKQLYQLGGISHILAVSGLHMTLMGAGIYRLLRRAGTGYGIAVLISFPCILSYAMLTGNSASCLRASFMLLVYLLGEWLGRSYDFLSSLSLAGLLLLMEIPARLFDSGFLLSFGAVLGIGIFYPAVEETIFPDGTSFLPNPIEKVVTMLLGSASLTIFTLPLSLFFFHGVSLAGILWNLFVIPLMSILFPLLFFGNVLCLCRPLTFPGSLLLFCSGKIIDFYGLLCSASEKIPGAYLTLGYRGVGFAIIYYGILGLFLFSKTSYFSKNIPFLLPVRFLLSRHSKETLQCVFHLSMACFLVLLLFFTHRWDTYFTMLDVGQGDGLLFHSQSGETMVIDGGSTSKSGVGTYILKPAFSYYGLDSIDDWLVSHTDEDHISGLLELLEAGYPIKRCILPCLTEENEKVKKICQLAQSNGTEVVYLKRGDQLRFRQGTLTCLSPGENNQPSDVNENSLVLLLSLPHQEILLTGDIGMDTEETLNQVLKNRTPGQKDRILKVAHHGSKGSTGDSFLASYCPNLCLISCGKNNRYGHPASETLERIEKCKATALRTDQIGAIEVRCRRQTYYFSYFSGNESDKN